MARVTHVKKTQQRYKTVPVIDPETGQPKKTPVMRRDGSQKTTKKGKLVEMTVTVADKDQPLPPYTCDYCHQEIAVGSPMKHITPKSGPYGGTKKTRHEGCPTWQVWEYSSSLSARLAQISHGFWQEIDGVESTDDVQSALDSAAEEITSLAEEKREGASNIEEGFGHPTSSSEELEQTADSLDEWAEEITGQDIPDLPDPEERYYITDIRDGSRHGEEDGYEDEITAQAELDSMLQELTVDGTDVDEDNYEITAETPDEPSAEQMDDWRSELQDALTLIDESPV